jgi:tetratricopeptide (TPR) repeat protein
MQDNLEYIDAYFQQMLNAEEIKRFEQKIAGDPEFADEVAFYLAAKQTSKAEADQEKKERFRQLLAEQAPVINIDRDRNTKRIWIYRVSVAAAVLVCLFLAWYFFLGNSASPQQMAEKYIDENLTTLSVKMSTEKDSMEDGVRLYNTGQYDAAIKQFESIAQRDPANYLTKKNLGIVYLRIGNYDKALQYFQNFEKDTLYSNPSLLYQALTLLKRNLPGDKQKAKELLQQVRDNDLEGKEFAQKWLDKW